MLQYDDTHAFHPYEHNKQSHQGRVNLVPRFLVDEADLWLGIQHQGEWLLIIGTLSKDVFERRTSTGSEAFSLFICLDANKFVLLSFFSLIKTIYLRVSTEPLPNYEKSPLPVDVRRSKALLLKLPNTWFFPSVINNKK